MKTLQIETSKATIMLAALPERAENPQLFTSENRLMYFKDGRAFDSYFLRSIDKGTWQIFGFLDSLSEEQKGRVCAFYHWTKISWKDYLNSPKGKSLYSLNTASDSFQSLLDSYGVTRANPYNEPEILEGDDEIEPMVKVLLSQWQAAEEKTFKNPLVLVSYK